MVSDSQEFLVFVNHVIILTFGANNILEIFWGILFILRRFSWCIRKHIDTPFVIFSSPQNSAKILCPCIKELLSHIGNPDDVSDHFRPLMLPQACLYFTDKEKWAVWTRIKMKITMTSSASVWNKIKNWLYHLNLFISASHLAFVYCCVSKQGRNNKAENVQKKFKVSHLDEKALGVDSLGSYD